MINAKRIYDPLYGPTHLTDYEYALVTSPEVQRLRYVRLCNINSLLITGASEISRFEHVLGVLRLAKEWTQSNPNLNIKERKGFIAASLLHDFQTGPFGHSMQYVLEDNEEDEQFIHQDISHGHKSLYHQATDANLTFCGRPFLCSHLLSDVWEEVAALIRGEGPHGPLISGSLDLDNLDNVIRLAYHVGIATRDDANLALSLARDIKCDENGLIVSEGSVTHVERWFDVRKRLYELLLLDWGEFSAKAMLTRAIELATEYGHIGADAWVKTDLELLKYLERKTIGDGQEVGDLVKRITVGDLYTPLIMIKSSKIKFYDKFSEIKSKRQIEHELNMLLNDHLGIKQKVIVHSILDYKKTQRAITLVVRGTKEARTIGVDSKQLLIGVFTAKPFSIEKLANVERVIKRYMVSAGLDDITDIVDPIDSDAESQLELI